MHHLLCQILYQFIQLEQDSIGMLPIIFAMQRKHRSCIWIV